jgi:hypothetical protein
MDRYLDRITDKLSSIPGYDAYRDKENRRETDRRVRERIAADLGSFAERIERIATDLANRREISAVGPVDSAAKSLRHVQNLVSTATYGYGGIFSDRNVDEAALDQLNTFDADLLTRAEALEPVIAQLETAASAEDRSTALSSVQGVIDGLKARFEERAFVVETGRPVDPEKLTSPLDVLEPNATKPLRPAAMQMKRGDALEIGGTNLIVDAVIDISGAQPMKLLRVDVAPERWLIVNERFAADAKREDVTESGDSVTVSGETLALNGNGTARATVAGMSGDSGERSVTYRVYGGATANGPIAVTLSWDSASLSLVGRGIAFDDIEIYGQPNLG